MIKHNDEQEKKLSKTYKLGRFCLYCEEPIEDQARSTKTHCTPWIDELNVLHDCKRRRHKLKTQLHEDILLDWCARQRETNRQLEKVVVVHGDYVSTEILNAYNVKLDDNIHFDYQSGIAVVEFIGFKIKLNQKLNLHKIEKI